MSRRRAAAWLSLAIAAAAGTVADRPPRRTPLTLGGYRVLAGDFHVHPFPLSAATLMPWDLALEAERQGLDVVAITPHNGVRMGRLPALFGGAMLLPGEEIHGPRFHLIALGTRDYVDWRLPAAAAIDAVHRQDGVAIAAHPVAVSWDAWGGAAARLDGAEVRQPEVLARPGSAAELEEFYSRARVAAIGSSDHHGQGPLGVYRTFVFARDASPAAVLDAIRAHRTVVRDGRRVFGDPELARFADQLPDAPPRPPRWPAIVGLAALAVLLRGERLDHVV
jgi:hypothetical protein